jgi:hypothetical protein
MKLEFVEMVGGPARAGDSNRGQGGTRAGSRRERRRSRRTATVLSGFQRSTTCSGASSFSVEAFHWSSAAIASNEASSHRPSGLTRGEAAPGPNSWRRGCVRRSPRVPIGLRPS